MREFLDVADTIRNVSGDIIPPGSNLDDDFTLVFRAIAELQSVFAKSTLELDNIESIFAAFEMAELFGRLGSLKDAEVKRLTSAIKSVIVTTLETRLRFPVVGSQIRPPGPYGSFANFVRELNRTESTTVTVMTFNYEIAIDYALQFLSMPLNYCLNPKDPEASISLLKLHGSLNWTRCPNPKCNVITVLEIQKWLPTKRFFLGDVTQVNLRMSADLPQCGACGCPSVAEPLIVPPTWNKTQHYTEIRNVWSVAARHLSEAENIVVIGYSLPATDHFFHYLYALGTASPTRLKRFLIINTDPKIGDRFSTLLGPLAKERLRTEPCTFSEGIDRLKQLFQQH
jgi:hypothetical protein